MTWKEFKAKVEAAGVGDDTVVDLIDVHGDEQIEIQLIGSIKAAQITSTY